MNNIIGYFGYGSLVNKDTRPVHTVATPTFVSGWIRQWKHCADTSFGKVCALTVARKEGASIQGVLIQDQKDKIADVDQREIGYRREAIGIRDESVKSHLVDMKTFIYVSDKKHHRWGNDEYPIYQSYLDCVLIGFMDVFGINGVENFVASTEGWDVPILNDRDSPKYPRAIQLNDAKRILIDDVIKKCLTTHLAVRKF